jgi:hypothetical protein
VKESLRKHGGRNNQFKRRKELCNGANAERDGFDAVFGLRHQAAAVQTRNLAAARETMLISYAAIKALPPKTIKYE